MTINDLIERLEDYREELGGDTPVRLMTQQNWPFENDLLGLTSGEAINDCDDQDDEDVEDDQVVYLVEGEQLGYGSKRAWQVAS